MATNPINYSRSLLTRAVVAKYLQIVQPTNMGKSMFPTVEQSIYGTFDITFSVQRFAEDLADFTPVGSRGQLMQGAKDTEKTITPPYMRRGTQINQLDIYNTAIGTTNASQSMMADLTRAVSQRIQIIKNSEVRRQEKMCWDVLLTGKYTSDLGVEDFGRSADSMVNVNTTSGKYWSDATADMYNDILAGCTRIRAIGKSTSADFILVVGEATAMAMEANTAFKEKAKFVNQIFDTIDMPQRTAEGACPWGTLRVGSYHVYVFTYPQSYDVPDANGLYGSTMTQTKYVPDNMAILVPRVSQQRFGHGAVPQLMKNNIDPANPQIIPNSETRGEFFLQEVYDEMNVGHYFFVSTRGCPLLIAKDQVYTMQCLA
jgi:hypothetical protein